MGGGGNDERATAEDNIRMMKNDQAVCSVCSQGSTRRALLSFCRIRSQSSGHEHGSRGHQRSMMGERRGCVLGLVATVRTPIHCTSWPMVRVIGRTRSHGVSRRCSTESSQMSVSLVTMAAADITRALTPRQATLFRVSRLSHSPFDVGLRSVLFFHALPRFVLCSAID